MSGAPRTSTPESLWRSSLLLRDFGVNTSSESSASASVCSDATTFSITDCVETWPSPTAA